MALPTEPGRVYTPSDIRLGWSSLWTILKEKVLISVLVGLHLLGFSMCTFRLVLRKSGKHKEKAPPHRREVCIESD